MRVVVAPDSYKGSLSAVEVSEVMARGIQEIFPLSEIVRMPVADGGEGTVRALVYATGGRLLSERVQGPLGEETEAVWGILGDGETAVIEMAEASGLMLVPQGGRDPRRATTFGTGELIKAALDHGFRKLIIGLGGSATNDGGAGMATALGAKFFDAGGRELAAGGADLIRLDHVDLTGLDTRLRAAEIVMASDVSSPLCGLNGASVMFGPQKGADEQAVLELDRALAHYGKVVEAAVGKSVMNAPGAGAAGGLGAGLLSFCNAKAANGIELILKAMRAETRVRFADLIFTGEGRTDAQTACGKAPAGVAALAKKYDVPVICLSGGLGKGYQAALDCGISGIESIVPGPIGLDECMAEAKELLFESVKRTCLMLKLGSRLRLCGDNGKKA